MARLPKPGSDHGAWADILNEFLLSAHAEDGTLKPSSVYGRHIGSSSIAAEHLSRSSVREASLADQSVSLSKIQTGDVEILPKQILTTDGQTMAWATTASLQTPATTTAPFINVKDFGALGDGSTDDTAAIQSAINAAFNGGTVSFPPGVYMTTGVELNKNGTVLAGAGRYGTRLMRLSGTAPLIDVSGVSTGSGHIRYCSVERMMLVGNSLPGALLRSYYADTCVYRDLGFLNCPDTATDIVELWDTRFESCTWENCGTTLVPATYIRNSLSTDTSFFGSSPDNTNQVHFIACRWERFRNGAVWLNGAYGGSTQMLNGIFFTSCKFETLYACGSIFQIMPGTSMVFVEQLYIAVMNFISGYTTPIDAITDAGSHTTLRDVYVQWGPVSGIANSAVHATGNNPHAYTNVSTFYPLEDPVTSTICIEPAATTVFLVNIWSNRGLNISGTASINLSMNSSNGFNIPVVPNQSFRVVASDSTKDLFNVNNGPIPTVQTINGVDFAGFSGNYDNEKWRLNGSTGAVRLASGKFQVESSKGYTSIGIAPYASIAMLIKIATDSDRGMAIVRQSFSSTGRFLEFQDETNHIQGIAFDSSGRPMAVGATARLTSGSQAASCTPFPYVKDAAGSVYILTSSPAIAGEVVTITFARPYNVNPQSIVISETSQTPGSLYVSSRSANGFTVSMRNATMGRPLTFDYQVIG